MHLRLIRHTAEKRATIGSLLASGVFECYCLEDVIRPEGEKVFGETAIPFGAYEVRITFSPKFKRNLPLLIDVPGFEGIRIHPGTTEGDTHGCLLVGKGYELAPRPRLLESRKAFDALYAKMLKAQTAGIMLTLAVEDGGNLAD